MKIVMALMTIGLFSLPAVHASDVYGDPFEGWGFVKDDWQVVCDNTLTCRAAGYAEESANSDPVSILIVVEPKKALPKVYVDFIYSDDEFYQLSSDDSLNTGNESINTELWLNDKGYGAINSRSDNDSRHMLDENQTKQLLRHARLNTKIEVRVGSDRWTISDKGMGAVLLKLDEVQGRVGTSIALVSKNHASKQTPKSAKPTSVIKKAFAYSEKDNKTLSASKQAYFQANINKWVNINDPLLVGSEEKMGDCELVNPKTEAYQQMAEYGSSMLDWEFIPVDATHTLAVHSCWMGAYNAASGYWLIDNAKPRNPQLITTAGNDYSDGEIWAVHKDRGLGDCWNRLVWVWDGQTFAKSEDSSSGMCRGFAGGAWDLPTYVSEVIE
ncbi:DUF1176 domain-containing protein [Psychrobacter fozii]|uniref:DUF1176 domain-containing protein n=1 Tax=Psychrobacter fozii TaxID=198480 RepID=UPI001D120F44|nr:DUF1176 domain-containing protein [Psychrobacter fozii]